MKKLIQSAVTLALVFCALPSLVQAQNLYFDPATTGTQTAGGSGSFNNSDFYNGSGDQLFTDGSAAIFQGAAGNVSVDAPVNPASLEINTASGTTQNFGVAGSTNAISIPLFNNAPLITIDAGSTADVNFNAPVNFVQTPATDQYGVRVFNNSSHNETFNNIQFSGSPNANGGGLLITANFGSSITLNGAVTNVTGNTGTNPAINLIGGADTTLLITNNASFSGVRLGSNFGTILSQTANFGTDGIQIENGAAFLTDAAGLNITNTFQGNTGKTTVGSNVQGESTFSGVVVSYGNPGNVALSTVAGSKVHFTNNVLSNGGPLQKVGAGVASLEHGTTGASYDVSNGTLLLNNPNANGSTTGGSGSSTLTIENVTVASPTQTVATLGGIGTSSVAVVAAGANSVISPGDMSAAGVSSIGTLTLSGGLTANNGLTMNFDLNGAPANGYDTIDFGGSAFTAHGTLTFNFTNLGSALSTGTDYSILTGIGTDGYNNSDTNFVLNAPAGYTAKYFVNDNASAPYGSLSVQFDQAPEPTTYALIGLGLLSLLVLGKIRKLAV